MTYIPREEKRELVEVHVAGSLIRWTPTGRIEVLLLKRPEDREIKPGAWEGCGGQVRSGEDFVAALYRKFEEELGLDGDVVQVDLTHAQIYNISRKGKPDIPGVRLLCLTRELNPKITLNAHTAFHWTPLAYRPPSETVGDMWSQTQALVEAYRRRWGL